MGQFTMLFILFVKFPATEALKGHCMLSKFKIYYIIRLTWIMIMDSPKLIRMRYQPQLSHPKDIRWNGMSSGWHHEFAITHPDEIPTPVKSSGRHNASAISHRMREIWLGANSPRWHRIQMTLYHPNDTGPRHRSSRWHPVLTLSHPDEILPIDKSSGWLRDQITLYPLDDIGQYRKSSGWHLAMPIGHPDEILPTAKSFGWLRDQITLSYPDDIEKLRMASGWHST